MIKFSFYRFIPDPLGRFVPIEELFEIIDRGGKIKVYGYYSVYVNKETDEKILESINFPYLETLENRESIENFIYGAEKRRGEKYNRVVCFLRKEWINELEKSKIMVSPTRFSLLKSKGLIVEETSEYYTEVYD